MNYNVIDDLPIDYEFSTKSKKELKLYKDWFLGNKEKRISELSQAVNSTKGFENWSSDFTSDSLKELGIWLKQNVEIEKIPEIEYKKKRLETPDYIELNDWDLTIKTRSLLVDVGIYIGEVFIHTYPQLQWEQCISTRKNDVNQGHMIIKMKKDFNPVWIMYIVGLGLADDTKDETCLINVFKNWSKYISSTK